MHLVVLLYQLLQFNLFLLELLDEAFLVQLRLIQDVAIVLICFLELLNAPFLLYVILDQLLARVLLLFPLLSDLDVLYLLLPLAIKSQRSFYIPQILVHDFVL